MATGRRSNPVLRPYEQQQDIRGRLSSDIHVYHQQDYISDALGKLAGLTDNIHRSMEQDKIDQYERDLETAREGMNLAIENSNNPTDWGEAYAGYTKYAEEHGKKLLGDRLYNKWLGDADHGYGFKDRTALDYNMRTVPKLLDIAKKKRIENAKQELMRAYLEKDPNKAKKRSNKATELLSDQTLFSAAEIEENKNLSEEQAAKAAFGSLIEKKPAEALVFVESESFKKAVKDPTVVEQYRNVAQKRLDSALYNKDFVEVAKRGTTANNLFIDVINRNGSDDELIEKIKNSELPKQQQDILYGVLGAKPTSSGAGRNAENLQVLTDLNLRFASLFDKKEGAIGGHTYRNAPDYYTEEQQKAYNSSRINKAEELSRDIQKAYYEGNISKDSAVRMITAINGSKLEVGLEEGVSSEADKETMPDTYESGFERLQQQFKDYGVADVAEQSAIISSFVRNVDAQLAANNMTAADLARLPQKEKDMIMKNAVGIVKKEMVDYMPFTQALPDNTGYANTKLYSGARDRYAQKVRAYNDNLGDIDWANFAYTEQQKRELFDLGQEAIREEVAEIQKTSKDILNAQEVEAIYYGLEEEKTYELGQQLVQALEYEIELLEQETLSKAPQASSLRSSIGQLSAEEANIIAEKIRENKKNIERIKKRDPALFKHITKNRTPYENYIRSIEDRRRKSQGEQ